MLGQSSAIHESSRPFAARSVAAQVRGSLAAAVLGAAVAAVGLAAAGGCSAKTGGGSGAATEAAKATVARFLDAIKQGDDAGARAMLSKVAQTKTLELGISVAPPVDTSATYAIRECELIPNTDDLVHVGTTWTDTDADGFTTNENVVWAVRLDPEGWRVVGMATKIFDDLPPLLLNFEDPEDMLAKQALVAEELQKRAQKAEAEAAAVSQPGQPVRPGQPVPVQPGSPRTAAGQVDGPRK
jgi:hypothetical protein